jgi:hypothetical protein
MILKIQLEIIVTVNVGTNTSTCALWTSVVPVELSQFPHIILFLQSCHSVLIPYCSCRVVTVSSYHIVPAELSQFLHIVLFLQSCHSFFISYCSCRVVTVSSYHIVPVELSQFLHIILFVQSCDSFFMSYCSCRVVTVSSPVVPHVLRKPPHNFVFHATSVNISLL